MQSYLYENQHMTKDPIAKHHQKNLDIIGRYLVELQLNENITTQELGEWAELHRNTIQRAQNGKNTTLLTVFKLADAFGISPADIISIID
jgi:hypothetical protein